MSTQLPVTPASKADEIIVSETFIGVLWGWICACLIVGLIAYAADANLSVTTFAVMAAAAPAVVTLAMRHDLSARGPAHVAIASWIVAAMGLTACGGGAFSPLASMFALAPILARLLNSRWVAETAAASVVGYGAAALLGPGAPPLPDLMAPMLAVISLTFAGALLCLNSAPSATPAPQAPVERVIPESALAERVAEVSHELRTPLTHILGFAEMIEREIFGPVGDRNVEYAGLIRKSGAHLLQLVNDLLEVSRIESGRYELDLERFDARAIIEEVVRESVDTAARKYIDISADLPATALNVRVDPRALRRMLLNTSSNAIKFTPEGGRVVIAARAEGRKLVIDTIDSGPGIPANERDRLGKPYERGANGARAEGTGLGLALVRGLVELHGGSLSFHDAPSGGALVRIAMPVMDS